jgi:non-lysosomal glucosylceramidase
MRHRELLYQYLEEMYPILVTVMKSMELFDTNNDGMIENSGFPDQTYDIWIAKGCHAYCGGLWITACEAFSAIARLLKDDYRIDYYQKLAEKARNVYLESLWNGLYLNYDNSTSSHHDSIMADMLAGQWYARVCQLSTPISAGHAYSCLKTIYSHNVLAFGNGELLGAVNGMKPNSGNGMQDAEIDSCCIQSRKVWSGTTYALSSTMLEEAFSSSMVVGNKSNQGDDLVGAIGSQFLSEEQRNDLISMAFNTAKGIHDGGWQKYGYWFATPEAWEASGRYRSLGYMRPLCIWSMQYSFEQHLLATQKNET